MVVVGEATRSSRGRERVRHWTCSPIPPTHRHQDDEQGLALAGARVGYAAAAPEVIDALRVVRLPYHLSSVTQVVALTALGHADELLGAVDLLREERDTMVGWLRSRGLTVAESDA